MTAAVYIHVKYKIPDLPLAAEHFGNGKRVSRRAVACGGGFCDQGDTGWYWTTAGKLKLARDGRERRVLEPRSWSIRSRGGCSGSRKNGFRGARWLGAVVFASWVIPGGTGRLLISSNSHAVAVSVAF